MLRPTVLFPLLAALTVPSAALADDEEIAGGGVTVLFGPGYWAEDGPARLRISARGQVNLVADDVVGLAFVMPVDVASSGNDGFGWSSQRTLVEVVPSARLIVGTSSPVRGYADLGAGPWFQTTRVDTVFGDVEGQRSGAMTSAALGLQAGSTEPGGVTFVVEPVRARTYFVDGDDKVRAEYGGMLGIGVTF